MERTMDEDGNYGESLRVEPGHPLHEHTAFGDYAVYADADLAGPHLAGGTAVTASEFERMEEAWYNIHHHVGLDIHGTAADVQTFNHMLADGMQHSEAFRHQIEAVGTDSAHTERINLGHHQADTIVDNFWSNTLDLDDLGQLPAAPRAGHHNEATRTEAIYHVLDERHYALERGHAQTPAFDITDASDRALEGQAHLHALSGQNAVRDDFGQSHVVAQRPVWNADGSIAGGDLEYANGDHEVLHLDHDNITGVTPPNDH
jgi:hypothetical protein